ncbi:PREDICTED: solute carrier family 22 member 24-like isoform X2 [Bison bison bison]|uniref:Solute carrier family 22 member 24-like isoform X2 n=1 Tax=Bison bison bison TaxID=43346 RepID=A0A6P3IK64_BISBB|nr:PREDICTED: solute carrier family 22 member 24-like isoform X2 [Bison bison bison]
MAFEELLDKVGGLGKFQILQMALIFPSFMIVVCHSLLENFTAAVPGHRCWVHILDNATVSDNDTGILSPDVLLKISIPLDSNLKPEKCRRFLHPQWQLLHLNGTFPNMTDLDTEPCVDGWVYDHSLVSSTIVTEWDLVCDQQSQKPLIQSLVMAGTLVGGLIYGHLSDRFGRKLILKWCLLQLAISGICTSFAPNIFIYCLLRFLSGCSIAVIITNNCFLIIEWTRSQSKGMVLTLIYCALSIGQMMLGGLAFVFREWRTLQLVLSVPFFVFFLSSRWLVESSRWLIITNKPDKGLKELKIVAHRNGMKNAEEILNLEVIFGALTISVRCLALYPLNNVGRRPTQMFFMFLVGLSILINMFVPQDMQILRVILASVGIGCAAASHTCFSVHQSELLPTIVRAKAAGLDLLANRCGAALAPLLMTLVVYLPTLPWIIYGVCPIIASLLVLLQPETRHLPLPDTIQDVENKKKFSRKVNEKDFYIKVTKF